MRVGHVVDSFQLDEFEIEVTFENRELNISIVNDAQHLDIFAICRWPFSQINIDPFPNQISIFVTSYWKKKSMTLGHLSL